MKSVPAPSRLRAAAAAVFLLAFALRAVFILQWLRLPYADALCADAWANDRWALDILENGLVRHKAFFQSPFYPYFLAAFYKIFGHEPRGVLWVHAAADSLSCVLLMLSARRCFGPRAGIFAGLAAALYRPFIFNAALLTKETFAVLGSALVLFTGLRAAGGRTRDLFLCGLAAGWAVLSRSNMALMIPALLLWLGFRRSEPGAPGGLRARGALALAAGAALAVLPATAHNFAASRDLVPVNYTGGFTFFLGNNPRATGLATYPAGVNSDPLLEEAQSSRLAELGSGRALKPSEVSSFWFRKGLSSIAGDPLRWLGLSGLKFWLFWNRYEIPDNYDGGFIAGRFGTLLAWPLLSFAWVGCFGAVGLFLCRPREASGLPLALFLTYMASILPFIISDRYRLPGAVLLIPAAAAALDRTLSALRERAPGRMARPLLYASPLMALCLLPAPLDLRSDEAAGWGQLAAVRAARGEFALSVEAFRRAEALSPGGVNEAAADGAALSLWKLGRAEEALSLYERWCRVYPGSPLLHNNRAALLFELGRTGEAVRALESSVMADPDPGPQYRNLFYGCARLGWNGMAARYGEEALSRFPDDAKLRRDVTELRRKARGSK